MLRLRPSLRGLAVSLQGPPPGERDPFRVGVLAVLGSARNVACAGGEPIGLTDCLNFGNPEKPAIGWELEQAIEGIAQAAEALGIPVVSGNVSLYNDTDGRSIQMQLENSLKRFGADKWGADFLGVNTAGHLAFRAPGLPEVDLHKLALILRERGMHTPIVVRFPSMIVQSMGRLHDAFLRASARRSASRGRAQASGCIRSRSTGDRRGRDGGRGAREHLLRLKGWLQSPSC